MVNELNNASALIFFTGSSHDKEWNGFARLGHCRSSVALCEPILQLFSKWNAGPVDLLCKYLHLIIWCRVFQYSLHQLLSPITNQEKCEYTNRKYKSIIFVRLSVKFHLLFPILALNYIKFRIHFSSSKYVSVFLLLRSIIREITQNEIKLLCISALVLKLYDLKTWFTGRFLKKNHKYNHLKRKTVYEWPEGWSANYDEVVLYFQIYVIQDIIRYCMAVCQQICQFLGIYCFDIVTPFPKKTTKNSWEESLAASKQTRWLGNRETCARNTCRNVLFFLHIYVWIHVVCTIILFS